MKGTILLLMLMVAGCASAFCFYGNVLENMENNVF